jgi:hypothetical protein
MPYMHSKRRLKTLFQRKDSDDEHRVSGDVNWVVFRARD